MESGFTNVETKLSYNDALNMNYYKKTSFSGWMKGMRFLLKKEELPVEDGEESKPPIFHAWVWPGPYIFSMTPEDKKTDETFPFTEEGRRSAVDWINAQLQDRVDEWPKDKINTDNM